MERLEELKKQIVEAEGKIKFLAKQNMDYSAEIMRLKLEKEAAEKSYYSANQALNSINSELIAKKDELANIKAKVDAEYVLLSETIKSKDMAIDEALREKEVLNSHLTLLRSQRDALKEEVLSLQKSQLDKFSLIESQNTTIAENDRRLKKINDDILSANDSLSSTKSGLLAEISSLEKRVKELTLFIDESKALLEAINKEVLEKRLELANTSLEISNKKSEFDEYTKQRIDDIYKKNSEADAMLKKNKEESEINERLRSALSDKEQELKLLELKIKEIARKKDIDAQIIALSK